jgi:cytochrome c-type biogenesis protein
MVSQEVTFYAAFLFGLLSFASPCVLPLIPSYLSYITGLSFEDLTGSRDRERIRKITVLNSLFFILGFSSIFVLLGASSSFVGRILLDYRDIIRRLGGILIIIFGLYVTGIVRFGFLSREKKVHLEEKPVGYLGSFLVGVTFAAGWTPCIGPILGSILLYASQAGTTSHGILLLSIYSIGLGLPFFLSSLALNTFLSYFRRIQRYLRFINIISGILLIIVGLLIFTDYLQILSVYITDWTGFTGI